MSTHQAAIEDPSKCKNQESDGDEVMFAVAQFIKGIVKRVFEVLQGAWLV